MKLGCLKQHGVAAIGFCRNRASGGTLYSARAKVRRFCPRKWRVLVRARQSMAIGCSSACAGMIPSWRPAQTAVAQSRQSLREPDAEHRPVRTEPCPLTRRSTWQARNHGNNQKLRAVSIRVLSGFPAGARGICRQGPVGAAPGNPWPVCPHLGRTRANTGASVRR